MSETIAEIKARHEARKDKTFWTAADALSIDCEVKELLRALDEAQQRAERAEWQPIETVPEDEYVLVAYDEPFFGTMTKEVTIGVWESAEGKMMQSLPTRELLRATHWQPLPTPPAAQTLKERNDV